jgi:predicted nucleotidyltransferase
MVKSLIERPALVLRAHREEVLRISASYGVTDVHVFGSIARGEDTPQSDVDLIVTFAPGAMSLGDIVSLEDELKELLGVSVDVISAAADRSYLVKNHAIKL